MSMPPAMPPIPVDVLAPREVGGHSAPTRGPWALMWRRLRRDKAALASMAFIILLFSFAAAAPLFESWTNHPQNASNGAGSDSVTLLPVGPLGGCDGVTDVGKDTCFILGASNVSGHDMLVQLSYGARTSLFIGVVSTAITVAVALVMGLLAGYSGGFTDGVISRLMDVVAAFPFLLFAIAVSTVFRSNVWTVLFGIAAFSWFYPARLFRAEVLSLREREFVSAARMLGASTPRILRKHIFPHLVGATVVYASLSIAGCTKNPVGGDDSSNIAMPYGAPPDRTPMLDAATANSPEVDASTGLAVAVVDASAADAAHEAGKPDAGKAKPPPSATAAVTATATHNWANHAKPYGAPPAEGMDLFV